MWDNDTSYSSLLFTHPSFLHPRPLSNLHLHPRPPTYVGFPCGSSYQECTLPWTVQLLPYQAVLYLQHPHHLAECTGLQPLCYITGTWVCVCIGGGREENGLTSEGAWVWWYCSSLLLPSDAGITVCGELLCEPPWGVGSSGWGGTLKIVPRWWPLLLPQSTGDRPSCDWGSHTCHTLHSIHAQLVCLLLQDLDRSFWLLSQGCEYAVEHSFQDLDLSVRSPLSRLLNNWRTNRW